MALTNDGPVATMRRRRWRPKMVPWEATTKEEEETKVVITVKASCR